MISGSCEESFEVNQGAYNMTFGCSRSAEGRRIVTAVVVARLDGGGLKATDLRRVRFGEAWQEVTRRLFEEWERTPEGAALAEKARLLREGS